MITNFAQFLERLQEKEAAILAAEAVKHGPTIGDMYEGLTKELVERAIPKSLGVQLVEGFVVGADGKYGHQTDAMLVMGDAGRQLPKTSKWAWPIEDVLAVFEVKKNLYVTDLADSLVKMRSLSEQQRQFLLAANRPIAIGTSHRAFARALGRFPAAGELDDFDNPGGEILRTIAHEQLAPVRVVFGYEGYADEHGLRQAFIDALGKAEGGVAGPGVLPNLVICRRNALVKLTGHPYIAPIGDNGRWDLFGSTREAPFRLLLELIWTRLANQFGKGFPLDDTLESEAIAPLLAGAPVKVDGQRGWYLYTTELSKAQLAEVGSEQWAPVELSTAEAVLFQMAMKGGGFDLESATRLEAAAHYGVNLKGFVKRLVKEHLVAWVQPTNAEPIADTIHHMISPDGKTWASTNLDLLTLWGAKNYPPNEKPSTLAPESCP